MIIEDDGFSDVVEEILLVSPSVGHCHDTVCQQNGSCVFIGTSLGSRMWLVPELPCLFTRAPGVVNICCRSQNLAGDGQTTYIASLTTATLRQQRYRQHCSH